MSDAKGAGNDPSMDDILASIRKIISDDEARAQVSAGASPSSSSAKRDDVLLLTDLVDANRAHPRQVIEADLVDEHPPGLDPQHARELPLEADRDVAEPDRAVAGVEQRARDDADRVREVDDPRVGRRASGDLLSDVEHHRHRAHRLGEAARAGRLLPDAATGKRHRLVLQSRRLAAHP